MNESCTFQWKLRISVERFRNFPHALINFQLFKIKSGINRFNCFIFSKFEDAPLNWIHSNRKRNSKWRKEKKCLFYFIQIVPFYQFQSMFSMEMNKIDSEMNCSLLLCMELILLCVDKRSIQSNDTMVNCRIKPPHT